MLDAFNRDDVDSVVAAFDERCEINEPPEMSRAVPPMGYRGHVGIREWMGNLRGCGRGRFSSPGASHRSGDVLLCELASRGLGACERGADSNG